ncbi:MAG TPA: FAD-binding oxidoreductase [Dehalococcoidia bacterium]|nr:FAD-binding oxidoreductase [Dehalococcoidia bacterium]
MSANEDKLLQRLTALVGDEGVETKQEERRFFAEDALRGRGGLGETEALPLAVVRPADAGSVAAVLTACTEAGVPVVPYGAGTGLMGGARTVRPGIVLDMVRLNAVEVQAGDRMVWAGAGAVLAEVDAEMRKHGLCLGHDPWTFPVATVGGTLSTNSLGYKGGRYGGMAAQALALEVALADGTLLRTRAVRRRSTGPDLARLFTGAEGTLGVITAAALEAFSIPEREELRAYSFPSFEAGFEAVNQIAALGMRPSLLDYGEEHASPWPDLAEREDEAPLLYLGFEGFDEEVDASLKRSQALIANQGGVALPQAQAQSFWDRRHVVAQRFARGKPRDRGWRNPEVAFDYMHVALPPSQVLAFREHLHKVTDEAGVGLLECGLWTAPDFFSCVVVLPQSLGGYQRLTAVEDGLLRSVQDRGGSMEYVHGAGVRLGHLMEREHGSAMEVLRRLKTALDPERVLNPGKLGL